MIKIDIMQFIKDHMWFGMYYDPTMALRINSTPVGSHWYYSQWWTLRLWPCLHDGKVLPSWWMAIFDYFGYAKETRDD